jgi:hypothetical protein
MAGRRSSHLGHDDSFTTGAHIVDEHHPSPRAMTRFLRGAMSASLCSASQQRAHGSAATKQAITTAQPRCDNPSVTVAYTVFK